MGSRLGPVIFDEFRRLVKNRWGQVANLPPRVFTAYHSVRSSNNLGNSARYSSKVLGSPWCQLLTWPADELLLPEPFSIFPFPQPTPAERPCKKMSSRNWSLQYNIRLQ